LFVRTSNVVILQNQNLDFCDTLEILTQVF
jgi:hypothetical protein